MIHQSIYLKSAIVIQQVIPSRWKCCSQRSRLPWRECLLLLLTV